MRRCGDCSQSGYGRRSYLGWARVGRKEDCWRKRTCSRQRSRDGERSCRAQRRQEGHREGHRDLLQELVRFGTEAGPAAALIGDIDSIEPCVKRAGGSSNAAARTSCANALRRRSSRNNAPSLDRRTIRAAWFAAWMRKARLPGLGADLLARSYRKKAVGGREPAGKEGGDGDIERGVVRGLCEEGRRQGRREGRQVREEGFPNSGHSPAPRPAPTGGECGPSSLGEVRGGNRQVHVVSIVHELFGTILTDSGTNVGQCRQALMTRRTFDSARSQFARRMAEPAGRSRLVRHQSPRSSPWIVLRKIASSRRLSCNECERRGIGPGR